MPEQPKPTFHQSPSSPRLRLPAGAWDTHCHVFGPVARFPLAPGFPPRADAPKETLFALHRKLGIARSVIVSSSAYGLDNRIEIEALEAKAGAYVGVALLPVTVAASELKRLDSIGFRGVRYNFVRHHKQVPRSTTWSRSLRGWRTSAGTFRSIVMPTRSRSWVRRRRRPFQS